VYTTLQRLLLWERRNNNLPPFNETVQQVFARISALRDSLDGPQVPAAFETAGAFVAMRCTGSISSGHACYRIHTDLLVCTAHAIHDQTMGWRTKLCKLTCSSTTRAW